MKVLIETLNNRKGYKFFENKEEMVAYLGRHSNKIANYEILNEYNVAVDETNEMLQSFIEDSDLIEKKLFWLFRQFESIDEKYSLKLIYASGRIYDACGAIRSCIK